VVDDAPDVRPALPTVDARKLAAQRPEGQRRRQRLGIIIVVALVLVMTGIVVTGYVIFFVLPHQQLIVRVDDVSYTRGDMVRFLRLKQAIARAGGGQLSSGDDVFSALQLIVENEIIAQSAPKFGISVTRQELDDAIRRQMAPSELESAGKDDDQIEREFREMYRIYLNTTQVSESEHRDLIRKTMLREKVRQFVGDRVPLIAEQVHLHRIAMSQGGEVDIMLTKLKDSLGDDKSPENIQAVVQSIYREFSSDRQTIRDRGDLGWVPRGILEDYEFNFFDLEVGELSRAVPNRDNPSQMYFFMVSERSDNRELDPINLDTLKTNALQVWVNEERANHDVFSMFSSDIYSWMIEQLRLTARPIPTPAGGNVTPGR